MDIRIRTLPGQHPYKCGANMGLYGSEERKPCGERAEYIIDDQQAQRKRLPSVGYVCGDHVGNVVEWYMGECK